MAEPSPTGAPIDALFRGAARLGLMLGALDLPWPSVTPLVAAFPAELRDELDLGVALADDAPDAPRLWLRTTVQGKAGTFRVARFLEERGVPEDRLRRLLVTANRFAHRHLLFLLGVGSQGICRAAWVLRQPLALPHARGWLQDDGVDLDARARVERVGQVLERQDVHALGEQLDLGSPAPGGGAHRHLLYFSQPAHGASWSRMEQASLAAGLPAAQWASVEARMPQLIGRAARLGLELHAGEVAAVRLEVEDVPAAGLPAGLAPVVTQRVGVLLDLAGREHLDLAGLRLPLLGPGEGIAWSLVGPAPASDATTDRSPPDLATN
ncbi:hypothetical protein L6R53_18175 [Myxococcota bacterium]|nr:hypothetical protein [Myxococcota bacterium]